MVLLSQASPIYTLLGCLLGHGACRAQVGLPSKLRQRANPKPSARRGKPAAAGALGVKQGGVAKAVAAR